MPGSCLCGSLRICFNSWAASSSLSKSCRTTASSALEFIAFGLSCVRVIHHLYDNCSSWLKQLCSMGMVPSAHNSSSTAWLSSSSADQFVCDRVLPELLWVHFRDFLQLCLLLKFWRKNKGSDSKYEVTRSSLQLRLKENQSYDILQPMKISFGNSDAFWKDREREDPDALLPKCEEKIHNWCVWWQRGYVLRLEMFRRFEDEMSLDKNIISLCIYIYVIYIYY